MFRLYFRRFLLHQHRQNLSFLDEYFMGILLLDDNYLRNVEKPFKTQNISSRYNRQSNGVTSVCSKISLFSPAMKMLEYDGANFVLIAVPLI